MTAASHSLRVLLVDDDEGFSALLSSILQEEGIAVIGQAADGVEGVQLAITLEPDVIVMDVHMPRLDGLEATRRLVDRDPQTRVLVVSASTESNAAERALDAGAAGFLPKEQAMAELVRELRRLHQERPSPESRMATSRLWGWTTAQALPQ